MNRILHPLFALLASVTRQDLARQVAYLKEENRVLRSRLPAQISVTAKERQRLIRVGRKLTICARTQPETICRRDVNRIRSSAAQSGSMTWCARHDLVAC